MHNDKDRLGSPGLLQIFWYVSSSVRGNKLLFALGIMIVGIAALQLDVMSYFAASAYQDSVKTIENSNLGKRVIVNCPAGSLLEESMRFTASRAEELEEDPMIEKVVPIISQGATFGIEGRSPFNAQFEGVIVGDPEFLARRMIWGREIDSLDCQEIVLTQTLFNMLYRQAGEELSILPDSKLPEFVSLETTRTIGGDSQTLKRQYRLVGILESPVHYAYLPFEQAKYIDMWSTNQIDDLPSEDGGFAIVDPKTEMDSALAFVAEDINPSQLEAARNHFNIELTEQSRIDYYPEGSIAQIRLEAADNKPLGLHDISSLRSVNREFRFEPIKTATLSLRSGKAVGVLAVCLNDSRLADLKTKDGKNIVELIKQPAHIAVTPQCLELFGISDPVLGQAFNYKAGEWDTKLFVDGVVEPVSFFSGFDILCSEETLAYIQYEVEISQEYLVFTTSKDVASAFSARRYDLKCNVFEPPRMFYRSGLGSGSVTSPGEYYAFILCSAEEKVVRDFCKSCNDLGIVIVPISILDRTGISKFGYRKVAMADSSLLSGLKFSWTSWYQNLGADQALAWQDPLSSKNDITINGVTLGVVGVWDEPFPRDLIFVHPKAISKYDLFFGNVSPYRMSRQEYTAVDVLLDEAWQYQKVKEEFIAYGFNVSDLTSPDKEVIICYEAKGKDKARLSKQLLDFLKADRTFLDVCPQILTKAKIDVAGEQREVEFSASHSKDWRRYSHFPFVSGVWLGDGKENEVVLPVSAIGDADVKSAIGTKVTVRFEKKARQSNADPVIEISCVVCGVIAGETGFLPLELGENVSLWQQGRIKYTSRQGFIGGQQIEALAGRNSCKLFIDQLEHLEPVVTKLRNMGYLTEDLLGVQQDVNRLGRGLTFLVIMLVAGCIVGAFASVTITTLMNTKKNLYETAGILPSLGASRKLVFRIFSIYALVLSFASYSVAMAGGLFTVGLVKTLVKSISTFPIDEITRESLFSPQFFWIHLMTLGVVLCFCMVGVWVSLILVYSTSISEAFGNKDQ